nr:MAG TPA: hypothetical protein [Microviridae sp.]
MLFIKVLYATCGARRESGQGTEGKCLRHSLREP